MFHINIIVLLYLEILCLKCSYKIRVIQLGSFIKPHVFLNIDFIYIMCPFVSIFYSVLSYPRILQKMKENCLQINLYPNLHYKDHRKTTQISINTSQFNF
jgi:hypothetical protein